MHKFQGKWITNGDFAKIKPCDAYGIEPAKASPLQDSHILFRAKFTYNGDGDVRLYYSADDYCKIYVNGNYVSCGPAPSYPFHTAYAQLSIKKYLRKGENLIAFHTYYQGLVNRVWVSGDNRHGLLFDVTQNGKVLTSSNENVKVRRHSGWRISHTVGYDTQFIDDYDSNSVENGFEKIDYDDSLWGFAQAREYADYSAVKFNRFITSQTYAYGTAYIYGSTDGVRARLFIGANVDTIEKATAWLAENPVEMVYALKEPIVTTVDIDLETPVIIEVQASGTIVCENNAKAEVPSSITYLLKEDSV
jgi:hypothetical protein